MPPHHPGPRDHPPQAARLQGQRWRRWTRRGPPRPSPKVADRRNVAPTNVPGSRNEKRWQDIHELLDAGIDVISTVNIQHLESLNDVVTAITGIVQRETVPNRCRRADRVGGHDARALRRRMAHGNIYRSRRWTPPWPTTSGWATWGALRELALLWLADKVDAGLSYRAERHHPELAHAGTRDRQLRRAGGRDPAAPRGARIASRLAGGHAAGGVRRPGRRPGHLALQPARRTAPAAGGLGRRVPHRLP
ncbi:MAG: hypothetical protein R2719_04415 [Micropruina sp.]